MMHIQKMSDKKFFAGIVKGRPNLQCPVCFDVRNKFIKDSEAL